MLERDEPLTNDEIIPAFFSLQDRLLEALHESMGPANILSNLAELYRYRSEVSSCQDEQEFYNYLAVQFDHLAEVLNASLAERTKE